MHKLTAPALLLAALALTACGGSPTATAPAPAPSAEVADDTDDGARTLASYTFTPTPAQARALGLSPQLAAAPASPIAVTVAVKMGTTGSKYAGQKRAYLGWKLNGKTFPTELKGTTSGSYSLALNDGAGALIGKSKAGTVSVSLPLASGNMTTSRSRSTAYVSTSAPACAVATFALTLPNGASVSNGAAPVTVCEPGTAPPPTSTPAPAPTLDNAYAAPWFSNAHDVLNHFLAVYDVPAGAQIATAWKVRDAEECGGRGDPLELGSGAYQQTTDTADASRPVFRVPVADFLEDFDRGAGIEWAVTLTLNGQTRNLSGLSCYSSAPQLM